MKTETAPKGRPRTTATVIGAQDTAPASRYGRAALAGVLDDLDAVGVGFRHPALFRAACRVGELAGARELPEASKFSLIEAGRRLGLSEHDARKQVERGLRRGMRNPRGAPETGTALRDRADAIAFILRWWEHVAGSDEFRGRRGATTLKILAGAYLLSLGSGKVRFAASLRELSEAAGVSVSTVHARRSELARWLREVDRGSRVTGERSCWQITTRNTEQVPSPKGVGLRPVRKCAHGSARPSSARWHGWSTGWHVAACLDASEPTSVGDLAEATGLHAGSVRRILARLAADGVVTRDGDGWSLVAEAPEPVSLVDFEAERRKRHQSDRVRWQAWRAARHRPRGPAEVAA